MKDFVSRAEALKAVRKKDYRSYTFAELEEIVRITGSKDAEAERRRQVASMGTLMKDKTGNLIRR